MVESITNGEALIAKNENDPIKNDKIVHQVEYYFGDINLPRDKFLQEELKKDNGWIPLSTMLKFNRLAAITTDIDYIVTALHNSSLIDLSDDNQKIRRNPDVPLPDNTLEYWQEIKRRTVYMKGFPQESTLDEISEFVGRFGKVENVLMRKTKGGKETSKIFKGSVFATFATKELAKSVVDMEAIKFKDEFELIKIMQDDYFAKKHADRLQQKETKRQMKKTQIEKQNSAHFKKGMVLRVGNLPKSDDGGESDDVVPRIEKLKVFFEPFGKPAFIDIKGNEATVRFYGPDVNAALDAWQKALEAAKEKNEGKVLFEGSELSFSVLDGEEESNYWAEFSKAKLAKHERIEKQHKGNVRRNDRNTNANRKRRADKGYGHMQKGAPKGKRTIFKDDDDEKEQDDAEGEKEEMSEKPSEDAENKEENDEPVEQKKAKVET